MEICPQDDTFLSTALDNTIRLWDIRTNVSSGVINTMIPGCIAYDPQGMIFATAIGENKINLYNDEFNGFTLSKEAIKSLEKTSDLLTQEIRKYLNTGSFSKKNLSSINKQLIDLEKSFISDKGMYFGSWYRSIYASSDPFSGYAAWILPGLEYEIALKSSDRLYEWDKRYSAAINSLNFKMNELINYLNK